MRTNCSDVVRSFVTVFPFIEFVVKYVLTNLRFSVFGIRFHSVDVHNEIVALVLHFSRFWDIVKVIVFTTIVRRCTHDVTNSFIDFR